MNRNGVIQRRKIFAKEFSLEWHMELSDIDKYTSPNFGFNFGALSNCNLQMKIQRYYKPPYFFSFTLLVPDDVVKYSHKLIFSARLLSDSGIQLSMNYSKTLLTVQHRMIILETNLISLENIQKSYIVILYLQLVDETSYDEMKDWATKNVDLARKITLNSFTYIEKGDDTCDEIKENNSINDLVDEQLNGQRNEEYREDLIKDLKSLYNSGLMSDIDIRIEKETLHAHKLILSARSPVSQKMMEHEFIESTTNCITITDCESAMFTKFLKYLYTGEIEDKAASTVMELYTLADKYDVRGLMASCSKILQSEFSSASTDHLTDIVVNVLQIAECYNDSKLKELAMSFIIDYFPEVSGKDSWKKFLKSNSELTSEVLTEVATALRKR